MRIGIIADAMDCRMAGITTYVDNLVLELINYREHEWFIFHLTQNPSIRKLPHVHDIVLKAQSFDKNRTITRLYDFYYRLRSYNLDVLHDPVGTAMLYPPKVVAVKTIHDLSTVIYPQTHTIISRFINVHLARPTLGRVNMFITPSSSTKNDLMKFWKVPERKIKVTYPGSKSVFTKLTKPEDLQNVDRTLQKHQVKKPYILSVGTLEPRKNHLTLIKAFEKLVTENDLPHDLVIIGKVGWKSEVILETINSSPVKNRIKLLNFLPEHEVIHLYNACQVFVYPSLYEGFGSPVLEAIKCGCPVITTKISSLPEVIGDAGLLLNDPLSVIEMSVEISKVINDQGLSKNLSSRGLIQASKFSWEKCARETLEAYKTAANT